MVSESGRGKRSLSLRAKILIAVGIGLVVLLAVIAALVLLAQNSELTRTVRDVFLIVLALEFMIVGTAMVVLMVQLARLILLLDLEIRPMLENANDTLNTLRGTSLFLTENLVEPVVQLNSSVAGIQRVLEVFGLFRKPS
jgi:hypothetical protein